MIPAGTVLTYQAKGRTKAFQGESDLVQELNSEFAQNNLVMRDYHSSWTSILGSIDGFLGAPADFQFTAIIQLNADFGSAQDVASIANHAIYQITDTLPSSSIPNMTVPGQAVANTGQPTQTGSVVSGSGSGSSFLSGLFQGGVNDFALLMVGVILAVVLIIAGKSRSII